MCTEVAQQAIARRGLNQCLLAVTRDHDTGLSQLRSILAGGRSLRLNTACLLFGEATFCHRASVCHPRRVGALTDSDAGHSIEFKSMGQ